MNNDERDLLLKSFDALLSDDEKKRLQTALDNSAELRREKEYIIQMRDELKSAAASSFAPGFDDQVMWKINEETETEFASNLFHIFRPVAVAVMLLIIITAAFNMWNSDQISLEGIMALTDISPTDAFNPLVDLAQE